MEKYYVLETSGGIGKQIAATAVVEAIKKQYVDRKIIVISSWEEPFWLNPNVYRVYKLGLQQYFYDDYIKDKDTIIARFDPYLSNDHKDGKSLIELWCKLINVEYHGEKPKIYLTQKEIETVMNKYYSNKKIAILHPFGSGDNNPIQTWVRDMPVPIGYTILNTLLEKGYRVLQPKLEKQILLNGAEAVTTHLRELFGLFKIADKIIGIDSFSAHLSVALDKKAMILYPVKRQYDIFGYESNINIIGNSPTKKLFTKYSMYDEINFGGIPVEYPYNSDMEIFNINEIIDKI